MVAVSPSEFLSAVEDALLGPSAPTALQRIRLLHVLRHPPPSLNPLLSYPRPKPSDRAQVQSREVRLPDSAPIWLDETDVQIALKLSDDLNLNEIECVRLLVSANREWVLLGRDPVEIFRLAAGLWYMERRDLVTSLYTLLRAIVLDQGLDVDLVADIQKYINNLFNSGIRQQLISLLKELNREEPSGFGGPNAERYLLDFRGALVERRAVVSRERLTLSHCLVLSVLAIRMSVKDMKEVFKTLKDSAPLSDNCATIELQITYSLLFSIVIAFISDALSTDAEKLSYLSRDASFRHEFHELVMATVNPNIEGFVNVVRLSWAVNLMITQDHSAPRDTVNGASRDVNVGMCLEHVCSHNVFKFLLATVLRSAAYQNDDEDMVYMYNGYLHKLMMCFVSHPLSRDKVKEIKEKAMSALSPYFFSSSNDFKDDVVDDSQAAMMRSQPFVSLLELIGEIYQKEPELLYGNDELWAFIHFAGEDHSNIQTLVAFLKLLTALASTEEGASKVFELLQGKVFRSVGWSTLFDCLSIYEDKFKHSMQTSGTMLPEIQEGDAQALVAYLNVLQKVVENGNPAERKGWFPDIEPLFKLLGYENVPPYLKGALRNAITAFIKVSPAMKDTIWNYLEQYDLPVVIGPSVSSNGRHISSQVYDMLFELDEVESRRERYPSTISFLNLLNALIAEERDVRDRGRRFVGIFRFIYDHVFGPFPQRVYADPSEKWQLVLACLRHFQLVLEMYDINEDDANTITDMTQPLAMSQSSPLETQLPVLELMKDFMSGKIAFRNIMSIILLGVNTVASERTAQTYGQLMENSVNLSLQILILVMERDLFLADFWRPVFQPLDIILSQDYNQVVSVLEYVRYDLLPQIQQCSIKIMSMLSSRMVGLVQLLLKSNAAKFLIEDFATCLESRFDESRTVVNTKDDVGVLILQLLIDNISRPTPNVAHLLLKFDVDSPVERTILQPKIQYSCLKVILDKLEILSKPDLNGLLHEFAFQLLYELCLDPLTSGPTMELLNSKKYQFFSKHLETICVAPLPRRSENQALRVSTLHQRAWLLKLLALELHAADTLSASHRETCLAILCLSFGQLAGASCVPDSSKIMEAVAADGGQKSASKNKVLELLEVLQFKTPDVAVQWPQLISDSKLQGQVEDILKVSSTTDTGGVYYYSERGDRLIDLDALHDKVFQASSYVNEVDKVELRAFIQQLLRWAWKHNKNLEEQAAQLHMLTAWSQFVEVCVSRKMSLLEDRSHILFELLGASLSASASQDCSLKLAVILCNVALTCMAKLRDEIFLCPGGVDSDNVTCIDIIKIKQLSNGACQSIFFKLMMSILRNESSEALRRRQYALLLNYLQYCRSILEPDVPSSFLRSLFHEEQDEEDVNLQQIDKEQSELSKTNFSIIKKEAQAVLELVTKDAMQGSEVGKALAFYVFDSLLSIDENKFFLSHLQSRGILKSCLMGISSFSFKDGWYSLEYMQRLCTLEAQMSLLLRVSYNYGKHGALILLSMDALEHLASLRTVVLQLKGSSRWGGHVFGDARDPTKVADKQRLLATLMLRLVSCLTSLIDTSNYLEVKNKMVREIIDFVKRQQSIFYQILRENILEADELSLENINLAVSILSKVWPYEENNEYGFVQELFSMMNILFPLDAESSNILKQPDSMENQKKSELVLFRICFSLTSYLYCLITKRQMKLPFQISEYPVDHGGSGLQHQPTLNHLLGLLNSILIALERAGEEKFLLLSKIQDINELSRQEVDEIINSCSRREFISSFDNIRKRRYIAMVEMCQMASNRDQLITLLLHLAERVLNIFLIHLQDENASQDFSFCDSLHPLLERFEQLREDKIGHHLKQFQRSVSMLKELSIRKIAL